MIRSLRTTALALFLLALAGNLLSGRASAADEKSSTGEKPSITVVFPSTDEVFKDLKFMFDLIGDEKGFDDLRGTIEIFLIGIDTAQPGGLRVYPTAEGLQPVLTFPISAAPPEGKKGNSGEPQKLRDEWFKKLRDNLWGLDVKTMPPPDVKLNKQIPNSVRTRLANLKLGANEYLIFGGIADGFMRYESGNAHLARQLADVRRAKGGLPLELVKGHDLAIFIDGLAQPAEERKKAFEQARHELVGALTRGETEEETAFVARKAVVEHQLAELQRFFVESSRIQVGWNVAAEEKHARLELEMEALPDTALAKSIELVGKAPDEFAGVSKEGSVFNLSVNFALDEMRKEFIKKTATLERDALKKDIAVKEKLSDEQKQLDSDLVDLAHDVLEGIAELGLCNGFLRSWRNSDGTLTTVGAGRIPEGSRSKFEMLLQKFAQRSPTDKIEMKIDSEGDIDIHRLTIPTIQKDWPDFLGADGVVLAGISEKSMWLATGENSLERLKKAIGEAKAAGPRPGPDFDLSLNFAPLIEIREKQAAREPKAEAKKSGEAPKTRKEKVEAFIAPADMRRLALEAFKEGKDTMSVALTREDKTVKLHVQFDEGLIRFVGKVTSKFVKENLADE